MNFTGSAYAYYRSALVMFMLCKISSFINCPFSRYWNFFFTKFFAVGASVTQLLAHSSSIPLLRREERVQLPCRSWSLYASHMLWKFSCSHTVSCSPEIFRRGFISGHSIKHASPIVCSIQLLQYWGFSHENDFLRKINYIFQA